MHPVSLNWWAVLVAGVAYWVLGAIWYARPVFGNIWLKGTGKSVEQIKAEYSVKKVIWALLASLLQAYGVARMMSYTMAGSLVDGLLIGALLSICLVFPAMGISDIMESRPAKLTWVNVLYVIVGYIIMGLILGPWR